LGAYAKGAKFGGCSIEAIGKRLNFGDRELTQAVHGRFTFTGRKKD
jgi:hypothetical protein